MFRTQVVHFLASVVTVGTLCSSISAQAQFFGPTPYLSEADSPFDLSGLGTSFYLEDFEDVLLNTPGVVGMGGEPIGPINWPFSNRDSVDGDDGVIDGFGNQGNSFFSGSGSNGVGFHFDSAILGALPTEVGIVWTDGFGTITFQAFDENGLSLGTVVGNHADGTAEGTTIDDRFYGVQYVGGISSIHIRNAFGGIEVDHLQYNNGAPDSDQDGLVDSEEIEVYGTDPLNPDTDGDGLLDGTEVDMQSLSGVPGCPNPLDSDSDDDQIPDGVEVDNNTNPCSADSDGDGICDTIDSDPNTPAGEDPGSLAASTRVLADQIDALPDSAFDAPNANAAAGRRNSMATRIRNAANAMEGGNNASASALLTGVLEKIDGHGEDWLLPSPLITTLAHCVVELLVAL